MFKTKFIRTYVQRIQGKSCNLFFIKHECTKQNELKFAYNLEFKFFFLNKKKGS